MEPGQASSQSLSSVVYEWLGGLREFSVEALILLGPDPFASQESRLVLAVQPAQLADAAGALAQSCDFGAAWDGSMGPLVGWQDLADTDTDTPGLWRALCIGHGLNSVFRIGFPMTGGRAFECYLLSSRQWQDPGEVAHQLAWSALNKWPVLKHALVQANNPLSARELESLQLAFNGLTAKESGLKMACTERTVTFHIAKAMTKLRADNKLAAIQRACWFGLF